MGYFVFSGTVSQALAPCRCRLFELPSSHLKPFSSMLQFGRNSLTTPDHTSKRSMQASRIDASRSCELYDIPRTYPNPGVISWPFAYNIHYCHHSNANAKGWFLNGVLLNVVILSSTLPWTAIPYVPQTLPNASSDLSCCLRPFVCSNFSNFSNLLCS